MKLMSWKSVLFKAFNDKYNIHVESDDAVQLSIQVPQFP